MTLVQKLVTENSFDAMGNFVVAGHIGAFEEDNLSGDEKHIKDVGNFTPAQVEIAPIAPTGQNPKIPQQIPPDAIQDATGLYAQPGGKRLVAEVTDPQEDRIEAAGLRDPDAEAEVTDIMAEANADGDADRALRPGASATVAELTADLGTRTDAQLDQLEADENAGKKRKGVLDAIAAERDARAS